MTFFPCRETDVPRLVICAAFCLAALTVQGQIRQLDKARIRLRHLTLQLLTGPDQAREGICRASGPCRQQILWSGPVSRVSACDRRVTHSRRYWWVRLRCPVPGILSQDSMIELEERIFR